MVDRAAAFDFSGTPGVQPRQALRPQLKPLLPAAPTKQRSEFGASRHGKQDGKGRGLGPGGLVV